MYETISLERHDHPDEDKLKGKDKIVVVRGCQVMADNQLSNHHEDKSSNDEMDDLGAKSGLLLQIQAYFVLNIFIRRAAAGPLALRLKRLERDEDIRDQDDLGEANANGEHIRYQVQ